uniref:ras association domain-containing protein 5-like n=1 Tax=Myxine glutinosa TaxID=7769 RepID=UPI00358F17F7
MPLRRRKGIAHRHVKTIFEHSDADPRLRTERGEGHDFRDCSSQNFCDLCGQVIWGIFKPGLRCRNCKVTCHTRCREDIQLDCQHQEGQKSFGDQQEHLPKEVESFPRVEPSNLTSI